MHVGTVTLQDGSASRFQHLRAALASEAPGALDELAAYAVTALAGGVPALAAASAGLAVLTEHLHAAIYRHAPRMLGILATVGPDAAADGADGLLAWAGAAIAHDYGVLPSWPRPDIATLMERAQTAPADVTLALACALGEVCERSGEDAEFAALLARVAAVEVQPDAAPFWRGHWAVVSAWHLHSFGRLDETLQRLQAAQALAARHHLPMLGATAALQRARLIECRRDPATALALADSAIAHGDPARTPLWWADHADIRCRIALQAADFHAAVGLSRLAVGHLQTAGVWPGYQVTYRANEAYALLGAGASDEALRCLNTLIETPLPRYLSARLKCLVDLTALTAADQRGAWDATLQDTLAGALRELRELEWPSVLPFLPAHMGRLFVRALVSGIELDWVRAAIRTRRLPAPTGAPESWPWRIKVRALGGFEVGTEAGALPGASGGARKASSKPLQLLRCLAAQGHGALQVDTVAAALWPGDGREGRQKAFDITVARLRRLLGSDAAVSIGNHHVRLNEQCVWVDVQALNDRLSECEGAAGPVATAALEAALALYRGPCLGDAAETWAAEARERLRARLAAALLRAGRWPGVVASQSREWRLRATSADAAIGRLVDGAS